MGVNNREKEGWGSSVVSTCLADTVRLGDRPQHHRKQRNNIIINNNKNQVPKKGNIGLKEPDTASNRSVEASVHRSRAVRRKD